MFYCFEILKKFFFFFVIFLPEWTPLLTTLNLSRKLMRGKWLSILRYSTVGAMGRGEGKGGGREKGEELWGGEGKGEKSIINA